MVTTELKIDPEFQTLLWPLDAVAFCFLEQKIRDEGCTDKIIVWKGKGIIVDGHNRYEICTKNEIPFETKEVDFADRDAVCDWIDKHQAGRRNCTPDQYKIITGRIYNRRKKGNGKRGQEKPDQVDQAFDTTAETVAKELGVSAPTIRRNGQRAEVYDSMVAMGDTEAAEAAKVAPQAAIVEAKKSKPEVAAEQLKKPHVTNNSGEQDWYTPIEFIESARVVLKRIDLDPASSEVAQGFVKASEWYSKDDNGLAQDWSGKIWLNPPYASGLVEQFAEKLVDSMSTEAVSEAIVLVNNATETRWFQLLAQGCDMICLPRGRIKFLDSTGTPKNTPLQGQAFIYFGKSKAAFRKEFSKYGVCFNAS